MHVVVGTQLPPAPPVPPLPPGPLLEDEELLDEDDDELDVDDEDEDVVPAPASPVDEVDVAVGQSSMPTTAEQPVSKSKAIRLMAVW
jgi:hypothetical protein